MNKILIAIAVALTLSGCAFDQKVVIQKELVPVDKPVPFIPKPPTVPPFVSQVDLLKADDIKDPGKIAVAYKYDMTQLRALISIYQLILQQYTLSSTDFDAVNAEIDKLYAQVNKTQASAPDSPASAP